MSKIRASSFITYDLKAHICRGVSDTALYSKPRTDRQLPMEFEVEPPRISRPDDLSVNRTGKQDHRDKRIHVSQQSNGLKPKSSSTNIQISKLSIKASAGKKRQERLPF